MTEVGKMSGRRPGDGEDERHLAERAGSSVRGTGRLDGIERWGTLLGGGMLMRWGLRRGGLTGMVGAAIGGAMAYAGVNGRLPSAMSTGFGNAEEEALARRRGWSSAAAVSGAVTVERPAAEVYALWRDFANLARFMEHVEHIRTLDRDRSQWTVAAPAGRSVSWIARVTEDVPDRRIAWETEPGADVRSTGWVEFTPAPGDRGTEVRARIVYEPPAGQAGRLVAKLFMKEPGIQMRDDLRRFKQLVESGPRPASAAKSPKQAGNGPPTDRSSANTASAPKPGDAPRTLPM